MPSGFSDGVGPTPETARGRDWPSLRQFCVFMENRVGRMHELLRHLEQHDLRVIALSVVDSVDFAVARLMVDNPDRARDLFALSNFTVMENDVLGVELPDDPQPFVQVFLPLLAAELNINYTYPLLYRRRGRGAIALHTDDIDQALQILRGEGHRMITEHELLEDDEFF